MKPNEFEDHLRGRLESYASNIDAEALWEKLDKKRRRRRALIWLPAGILALCAVGFGISTLTVPQKQKITPEETAVALTEEPLELKGKQFGIVKEPLDRPKEASESAKSAPIQESAAPSLRAFSLSPATQQLPLSSQTGDSPVQPESENITNPLNQPSSLPSSGAVSLLSGRTPSAQIPQKPELDFLNMPQATILSPKRRSDGIRLSADIDGGVLAIDRRLESLADNGTLIASKRNSTEQPLESVTAFVLARVTHRSGLFLRTGFGYTRLNERFEDAWSSAEPITIPDAITAITITPAGDTLYEQGDLEGILTRSRFKRHFNTHHLAGIPIGIGYAIQPIHRFSAEIEVGTVINVLLKSEGVIWSEGTEPVALNDEISNPYRRTLGLSLTGAMKLKYAVSDQLAIAVGPYLRTFSGTWTSGDYPLRQNYTLFGLNAGCSLSW